MQITWTQFAWGMGLFLAWNGFLVGIIRFFIAREIRQFETKLEAAEKRASEATKSAGEVKQSLTDTQAAFKQALTEIQGTFKQSLTEAQATQKLALVESMTTLRVEFSKRQCGDHDRMEGNDKELFSTLRLLHGDIQNLVGGVEGLTTQIGVLMEHHINGRG